MPEWTPQRKAMEEATLRAAQKLAGIDLAERCLRLGLRRPDEAGRIQARVLAQELLFEPPSYEARVIASGQAPHPLDRILLLNYLLCDVPLKPGGEWVTFRDFPGGQFYWKPFLAGSAAPLARNIGNDTALLRQRLERFDWVPMAGGDLGAKIHVLGDLHVALIYNRGDDEFPAHINVLFEACFRRAFQAEYMAGLARRICFGLG